MRHSLPAKVAAMSGLGAARARDDLERYRAVVERTDPGPLGA